MRFLSRKPHCGTRRRAFGGLAAALLVAPVLATAIAAGVAGAAGASPARAAAPSPGRVGATPRLPRGAVAVGALSPSTLLHVDVVLQPRDPAGLARFASEVSTPGSPLYRRYLRRGQFALDFGPTPSAIAVVEGSLRQAGLRPGTISPNHLIIPVTATAAQFSRAFSTSFDRVRVGGRSAYANTSAPLIAGPAKPYVQAVLGLDDLAVPHPSAVLGPRGWSRRAGAARAGAAGAAAGAAGPAPCSAASAVASSTGPYTDDQVSSAYGFSGLYSAGDLGGGLTVALIELEPFSPGDISTFQSCYGTSATVRVFTVDGGAGTGAGSGEAALDIETVAGFAPQATIDVYEAPGSSFSNAVDTYNAMVTSDTAQVISSSWLACEYDAGSSVMDAENTIFEQAASQGQSVFAASGDLGSEGCDNSVDGDYLDLYVSDPASQPFVTGVGGTYMPSLGNLSGTQSVWDDGDGAGGGGTSQQWGIPSYQSGAASSLGVENGYSDGWREVPDVSAAAAPVTGTVIYYTGNSFGGWGEMGGTSFGAPLWAALTALVDRYGPCGGASIGFANPVLYKVAGQAYSSLFTDVTRGNNDWTGYNSGLYPALGAYDMATGLGTPNGYALANQICDRAPNAPFGVTAGPGPDNLPGDGEIDLSWTAPTDNGSAISSYTVAPSPPCPGSCGGLTTPGTSTVVTGLTPGQSYTFSVTATNAVGTGPAGVSGSVVPVTVPSAPGPVGARASSSGMAVTFGAPAVSGGAALSYIVSVSPACPGCRGTTTGTTSTVVTGLTQGTAYRFAVRAVNRAGAGAWSAFSGAVVFPLVDGYWLVTRGGSVFALGAARSLANAPTPASDPVVGIASMPNGTGYFVVTLHGTVSAAGGARFRGDLPQQHIARSDIVSIVATLDGNGYWLVGGDGEVYPFGDAPSHGDLLTLPHPVFVSDIVGMVACAGDAGYLLIGSDGGVFAFGRTHYYGSLPGLGIKVNDIRAILPSATNTGYVLVGADGGAFVFGTGTRYYGSLPGRGIKVSDVVGLAITPDGQGYYMAGSNGAVYGFGDAIVFVGPKGLPGALPVAAIAGV
jgi:hypothetical protein